MDHPKEFLKGFEGVCVTAGYQAHHSLEEKTVRLMIVGSWAHARKDVQLAKIPTPASSGSGWK